MDPIRVCDVRPVTNAWCHVFIDGGNKLCGEDAKWQGMYHGSDELYYTSVFSDQESVGAVLLEVCEAHAQQLWPEKIKEWAQ